MCRKRGSQGKSGQTSRKSHTRRGQAAGRSHREQARPSGAPGFDGNAPDVVGDHDGDDEPAGVPREASLLDLWEADELDEEPVPEEGDFWFESDRYSD